MFKHTNFVLVICIGLFTACDIIEPPFIEEHPTTTTNDTLTKVLLEDFTGHKCVKCPAAHDVATQLKDIYGDQLIIIAIHAGYFAEVDAEYTYDFNTTVGTELNTDFSTGDVFPIGVINQLQINNSYLINPNTWGSVIDTIVDNAPKIYLKITNSYNATTRVLSTDVQTKFLADANATYKLVLYLTEDSIVAAQKDEDENGLPIKVDDYVHNHVLRDAINGTWGDTLIIGAINNGYTATTNFTYTLNQNWVAKHCNIVAFVFDDATKEVVQAEQENITE